MAISPKGDKDQDGIMADINITPLIEIMLVLLIIFMVTSSVSLESGLDVDLPKTKTASTPTKGPENIVVTLTGKGALLVQGSAVSNDKLELTIKDLVAKNPEAVVILEGDKQISLGRTIEIMDTAKAAGAKKFAIAAQTEK